jgi:hypothetical protein
VVGGCIEAEEPGGLKTTISDVNQSGRWYRVFTPPPPHPPPTIIKQLHSFLSTLLPTLGKVFRQVRSKKSTTKH